MSPPTRPSGGSSLREDMETQRVRIALEEERQQRQYAEMELAQLRVSNFVYELVV
jgi:hypothetical protein